MRAGFSNRDHREASLYVCRGSILGSIIASSLVKIAKLLCSALNAQLSTLQPRAEARLAFHAEIRFFSSTFGFK